jgi:hypothetical protein
MILAPDILAREFDIKHRGVNVRVAHQAHQSRQRKAGTHHVGSEGMAKAVSIGLRNVTAAAMMAKQGAEASGGHGLASLAAFERKKQIGAVAERSFQAEVTLECLYGFVG